MRPLPRLRPFLAALSSAALLLGCAGSTADDPDPDPSEVATPVPRTPAEAEAEEEPEPPAVEPGHPEPPEVDAFEDPDGLAAALAAAEEALADPDTPEEHRDGWAWIHQQAYRDIAANPQWRDVVRDQLPEERQEAFDLTQRATSELFALTTPRPELPDSWRIVAPPPVEELRGYYEEAEAATGAPWNVLAAIHLIETRFGRIQGDSHAGAQGPMQFMPPTWDAYGEGDVRDPRDAIMAAGRYLAASGAPGDLRRAVFAYNRSDYYVEAVLAHAEAIERFEHYLDVYHRWRVYYRTVDGDVVLEEGYGT